MGLFYTETGQNIQSYVTLNTIFWAVTIILALFIIAIFISGYKQIVNKKRLKWLLLNIMFLFVVGYFFKNLLISKFLEIVIFTISITIFSIIYIYLIYESFPKIKDFFRLIFINFLVFYTLSALYEILLLTSTILRIFFAAISLTLIHTILAKKKWKKRR